MPGDKFRFSGCVISFFYIKPQLIVLLCARFFCCVISFFYIKPQPIQRTNGKVHSCVISFFYIKPQLTVTVNLFFQVVLYPSSTSNHNLNGKIESNSELCYILLLHQTTTDISSGQRPSSLCYILLLHQTTTKDRLGLVSSRLCYILLLHQTTTSGL